MMEFCNWLILLGFLAFGVCANAFAPAFSVKEAFAELTNGYGEAPFKVHIYHRGSISQ